MMCKLMEGVALRNDRFPFPTCVAQHTAKLFQGFTPLGARGLLTCSLSLLTASLGAFISVAMLSFSSKDSAPSLMFTTTFLQTISSPFHLHYTRPDEPSSFSLPP